MKTRHKWQLKGAFRKRRERLMGVVGSRSRRGSVPGICVHKGDVIQHEGLGSIAILSAHRHMPPSACAGMEIARNVVESQRLSTLIGYATAAPFAIGFFETALAIEDSSNGI